MIEGRTIVCLASSWDYDPTSKHHIMRVLSQRNRIVWVNYHGTRRPLLNRADVEASVATLRHVASGIRPVSDTFVQVTPLVIPGARGALARRLHQRMLIAQIRRAIRRVSGGSPGPLQVWAFAPDVPYLVGQFGEECFVYYCVDDYTRFEGLDSQHITEAENELVDRADVVITTSEGLHEAKRSRRADALLVRHGVDYRHFASAWRDPPPRPADIADITAPIFGFFGLIQFWVDRRLIAEAARLRPHYQFVLIGDAPADVGALSRMGNVRMLGRRPNASLPAYCAAFEAGLMPFTRTDMTRSINPIKMYEYLAAGLPIISTTLPEAQRFAGPVLFADTPAAFAEACDRVLAAARPGRREEISRLVSGESWESKVELLSQLILNRGAVLRTAAKPSVEVPQLPPPPAAVTAREAQTAPLT
ncbi:MAG: glycosyltransferase [Planctomycetes bacterium]|nr:glycosyltransferase [Planctomycetota bacterium]